MEDIQIARNLAWLWASGDYHAVHAIASIHDCLCLFYLWDYGDY